ncbi:hypothetical protein [Halorussus halophilus]|uniref:hypothetical protein n=1 Tax=Halorussus halophilus TaxID=2650975 RepID=UPI0013011606|nr:hypothetical protein [Halorussus halophilus]
MATPTEDDRERAALLAERADHWSVTTERLAGSGDAVSELQTAIVSHLLDGESPKYCFDCHERGVGMGDPDDTVVPERGGVFLFTDERVYLHLGVGEDDKSLNLDYESIQAAEVHVGVRRHRIELELAETSYHLWIPTAFDEDDLNGAVGYARFQHKRATPDSGDGELRDSGPKSVKERLERLGEAHSRGLVDTEEFERRRGTLLEEQRKQQSSE